MVAETRRVHGIAILGLVLTLVLLHLPAHATDWRTTDIKSLPPEQQVETYLQSFMQMSLWYDFGFGTKPIQQPSIYKLGRTLRVRFSASGYEEFGKKVLGELASLAHLDLVFLAPDDKTENLFIEIGLTESKITRPHSSCFTMSDIGAEGQRRGHILMDTMLVVRGLWEGGNSAGFFGCFNHETMHALGFGHAHEFPSVMSYAYSHWFLTDLDKMMVSAMYDPRLKSGMDWLPALATARTVITDKMVAAGAPPATRDMGRQWMARLVDYMTQEANAGNVVFQAQLGFAYTFGYVADYVPKDPATGFLWLKKAAENGHRDAQANLGISLMNGRGVTADPIEAIKWLRMGAEQGHANAQYNLGLAYRDGKGVTEDSVEGFKWIATAMERNLGPASAELQRMKPKLTPQQLAAVTKRAESGDLQAQFHLGLYYTYTAPDLAEGYRWFRRSAEGGYRESQSYVGYALMAGRGVTADPVEAVRWMRAAAVRGQTGAQFNLARAYRDGTGIRADAAEAYRWMASAADRGMPAARAELAAMEKGLSRAQVAKAERELSDSDARDAAAAPQLLAVTRTDSTARPPAAPDKVKSPMDVPDTLWSTVTRVMPKFPPAAEARGANGRVILLAEIGIDGLPHNVRVADSTGHADLDAEGVKALEQWRFKTQMPVTAEFRFLFRPGAPPSEDDAWR